MVVLRSNSGDYPDAILALEFPETPGARSRKVVTRSRARATGKYPSWKMGRMIQWESSNELNAYRLLDANPVVRAFHEQPLVIRFCLDGTEQVHYPDTLVELASSRELWEIKPAAEAARPEYRARTQLMVEALPDFGFTYRMVIAEDLAREPRLTNTLSLLKYGRQAVSLLEREKVRQILLKTGGLTWGDAITNVVGPRSRCLLARLALEGSLHVGIDEPLTPESRFVATAAFLGG